MIPRSSQRIPSSERATAKLKAATSLTNAQPLNVWLQGAASGSTLYVKVDKHGNKFVSSHKHSQRQPFAKRFGSHRIEKLTFVNVVYGLALSHHEDADPQVQAAVEVLMDQSQFGNAQKVKNTKQLRDAIKVLAKADQAKDDALDLPVDSEESIGLIPADEPHVLLAGDMFLSSADKLERARRQLHGHAESNSNQTRPAEEPLVEMESNATRFMGKPGYLEAFRAPLPPKTGSNQTGPADGPRERVAGEGVLNHREMRALAQRELHSPDPYIAMAARFWLEWDEETSQ